MSEIVHNLLLEQDPETTYYLEMNPYGHSLVLEHYHSQLAELTQLVTLSIVNAQLRTLHGFPQLPHLRRVPFLLFL